MMPSGKDGSEQQFSIQPHPAKTNDPSDMQETGGMRSNPMPEGMMAPGPMIPTPEMVHSMDAPAPRDEMHARAAELNKIVMNPLMLDEAGNDTIR
ncbi:hypothetical protein BV25DRAFT_1277146 [Artomyces pyxidatus]|uniref:Uncharacterized protein n=1 Tax=Artomyces pyxidatus TaxID=48021 RepID=A0ACB8TF84_9AGAM|nr:hypothetical protein BV25DRAFT_1277146 [Artomyces pyxidatus]